MALSALLQDTVRGVPSPHAGSVLDSVELVSPIPDPFVPIVQWLFQKPPMLMLGGLIVATILAVVALVIIWRRRAPIRTWFVTRDRPLLLAMAGLVAVFAVVGLGLSWKTYDYVMHDNDFCKGCHIFVPSGQAMVRPDTGTYLMVNAVEGEHSKLQCHDCHPFEAKAQMLEFVAWVTERPEVIPPHAKVPQDICAQCHIQGDAKETWEQIAATAGHRTHFESDSLEGEIECLTCHAQTAHRFAPADSTCGQAGCHVSDDIDIEIAAMQDQTDLHCATCHQFAAEVPALATTDSARGTLRPAFDQCTSCHAMRQVLAEFDPARDPHDGTCGMCHNPHEQTVATDAAESCTTAGCHADWRTVDFHTGASHRDVARDCTVCHQPHAARVDASDCTGCHAEVRQRTPGRAPPMPFDTTAVLRRTSHGGTVAPSLLAAVQAAPDTFSHAEHEELACLVCHQTRGEARLTFEPPRGCQICHHQPARTSRCAECHAPGEIAGAVPVNFPVTVEGHAPRARTAGFEHGTHDSIGCTACHTQPVSLAPSAQVATCQSCHDEHHEAGRQCAECHGDAPVREAHDDLIVAHTGCDACHTASTVAALTPTRSFCLTCHSAQQDHYPERECTVCHFLTEPGEYRSHLLEESAG
jgi:hypothetical protein